jgi:hypothetical protein
MYQYIIAKRSKSGTFKILKTISDRDESIKFFNYAKILYKGLPYVIERYQIELVRSSLDKE